MAGYLDGELDLIANQTPRCGPTPERGVVAKTRVAKQELRKITAARALIRRISGIKSSEISKDRCEATCQVKPKTTKNQYYVRLHFSRSRARRNRSPRLSPLHVLDWACLDHKQQSHQPTTTTTTTTQPQS